jgi:hypothetical protein
MIAQSQTDAPPAGDHYRLLGNNVTNATEASISLLRRPRAGDHEEATNLRAAISPHRSIAVAGLADSILDQGVEIVPRILLSLSAATLLLASAALSAGAQTPAMTNTQAVTSPSGYQYQVPSDWQQLSNSTQQHMGNELLAMDGEATSADGAEHAHVETATGFGIAASDLPAVLATFFAGPPGAPAGSVPALNIVSAPAAVQVAGADAAQGAAAMYADPSGTNRVVVVRLALRGQTTYLFTVDVTQAFYQSDPSFAQIMNSFQLMPSVASAAGAQP